MYDTYAIVYGVYINDLPISNMLKLFLDGDNRQYAKMGRWVGR